MNEKTPDLDTIPTIKPAQDEVTSYRRSQERRPDAPQQSNFNGTLVFVIIVLAVMMGLGGFTLYEVQEKLDQTTLLLSRSKDQITELQRRLSATDQDFAKSGNEVDRRLGASEFEIRKLWDLSNKTNKGAISRNKSAITNTQDQVQQMVNRVGGLASTVDEFTGSFQQLDDRMGELVTSLTTENDELTTQLSMLRGQVQDQSDDFNGVKRATLLMDNRLEVTEEAIAAIDQHRKQLNADIAELTRQVKLLQAGPE